MNRELNQFFCCWSALVRSDRGGKSLFRKIKKWLKHIISRNSVFRMHNSHLSTSNALDAIYACERLSSFAIIRYFCAKKLQWGTFPHFWKRIVRFEWFDLTFLVYFRSWERGVQFSSNLLPIYPSYFHSMISYQYTHFSNVSQFLLYLIELLLFLLPFLHIFIKNSIIRFSNLCQNARKTRMKVLTLVLKITFQQ